MPYSVIRRILIVDDDICMRHLIKGIIGVRPVKCELAADPFEALERLRGAEQFDLVISDILMPKMDGLDLVRRIRRECPHVDCIVITAHSESFSYQEIIDAGAADFIHKPFTAEELIAKIERIARERSTVERLRQANEALSWKSTVNESLTSLARSLLSNASLEETSLMVLDHTMKLTESPYGYVGYIDPKTGYLVCPTLTREVWNECRVTQKSYIFDKFAGLWGWVLKKRKPIVCNDPALDPRSSGAPPGHIPINRFISVPVVSGEELVGQIAFANSRRDYDDQDLALLQHVADIYAISIERLRYQQEIDQYQFHLEELVENRTIELIETNKQLQASERRTRELNEQILDVLMIMSHDIRGPLVSMAAILKLMLRGTYGDMEEGVTNTTRELLSRAIKVIGIAEDCLVKANALGYGGETECEMLDLEQDVIDRVLDEMADEIEAKGIAVHRSAGVISTGKVMIKGSKVWLKAIYRNLLGNAIKHGGDGCTISFGYMDCGSYYRLNVHNTGSLIPEDHEGKLFTKYGRIRGAKSRQVDGVGFGLYLIRDNIRKAGGDMWYEARPDGPNFVFTITKDAGRASVEQEDRPSK